MPDHVGTAVTTAGKRARKSAWARRVEILAAAGQQFADTGYRGTDVQDIADSLGVGKGTIYRFYPTKEALFLATVEAAVDELREFVAGPVEDLDDPLDKIRTAVHRYLDFFDRHPHVVELFIQERAEFRQQRLPIYFAQKAAEESDWFPVFHQLIAEGRMRSLDPQTVAETLGAMLYGAAVSHRLAGSEQPLAQRADELLDVVLHGILDPNAAVSG